MKYLKTLPVVERGILTSSYKQDIKRSVRENTKKSLSSIKSLILNHHEKIESQAGTILKVSFFMLAIVFMVF